MPDLLQPVHIDLRLPLIVIIAILIPFVVGALADIQEILDRWRIGRERREFRRMDRKARREFKRQARAAIDKADP